MRIRHAPTIFALLSTTACGISNLPLASPTPPLPPNVSVHADPAGDAGALPTWDVIEIRSERGLTTLDIRVWLTTTPRLPAPGSFAGISDMMFQIGFNSDRSRTTGTAFIGPCTAPSTQGIDFLIDGGFIGPRNANGTFNLRRTTAGSPVVGPVTVTEDGPRVTFTSQYSAFGGTFQGRAEALILVGFGPPTAPDWRDCAPDAGEMLPTRRD